jgi:N-acetylglucosamine kinase-like BadF-type ATPase
MAYFLALDQGGTKTAALVADEAGNVLGAGYSKGACHAIDGMPAAMARAAEACRGALEQAAVPLEQVGMLVGGLTGADWPHEYPLLQEALRQTLGIAEVVVVNDCIIAFRAGTDSPAGGVLCAGTGLNAAVISPAGEQFVYGYYVNGDENGGTALGKLAMRAVINAETGVAPPTLLTRRILDSYSAPSVDDLICRYAAGRLGETKELVPLLAAVVQAGDGVAQQLVADFGARLARYIVAGFRRYGMLDAAADVVLSGGVFKAGLTGLREAIGRAIRAEARQARLVDAPYEPVLGALLLALDRRSGGSSRVSLDSEAIIQSAARFGLNRPTVLQGGLD